MAGPALVSQLWSLLDEMAENEPEAYRRFQRQQRAEAERLCAPPEPHLCLRARPTVGCAGFGVRPPARVLRRVTRAECGAAGGGAGGALSRGSASCRESSGDSCSSTSAAGKGCRRPRPPLTPLPSVRGRWKKYLAKEVRPEGVALRPGCICCCSSPLRGNRTQTLAVTEGGATPWPALSAEEGVCVCVCVCKDATGIS